MVMRIGAEELPDVEALLNKLRIVFIVSISLPAIVFVVGLFKYDYSMCIPYSYPPILKATKGLNLFWNVFSIALYCITVKRKNAATKEAHSRESEEIKACRKVYE